MPQISGINKNQYRKMHRAIVEPDKFLYCTRVGKLGRNINRERIINDVDIHGGSCYALYEGWETIYKDGIPIAFIDDDIEDFEYIGDQGNEDLHERRILEMTIDEIKQYRDSIFYDKLDFHAAMEMLRHAGYIGD